MAAQAGTFTVGVTESNIGPAQLTSSWGGGYLIAPQTNTSTLWVAINPTTAPTVEGDDCFPLEPGERIQNFIFPIRVIAGTGGNKLTVSPY